MNRNNGKFTITKNVGELEILLKYDVNYKEFSWECGEKGAIGFSSIEEAENDAIFWLFSTEQYINYENIIRADNV